MPQTTVYFDNAATTFPKPQSVLNSAYECMSEYCGNAGRGSHPIAMMSAEKVFEARVALADFFGSTPENVVFTLNTTYALNMAIKGVMSGGGHMLISNMEHNSVLRPAAKMARDNILRYDIFKAYDKSKPLTPKEIIGNIISKLRKDTRMLTCIHSSNICSYSLPIREIGQFCRRHGILFCVDAAQSAGHLPIDMEKDCIDVLCLPAHKGLYAPQGCGIMIMRKGLQKLATLTEGGNGVNSLELSMGSESPERYEGGTLCTPAIAGLVSGIGFIKAFGLHAIANHERRLWRQTYDRLSSIPNLTVYDDTEGSVLLFNADGIPADDMGALLSERGFCLRTGYHCSPLAHRALATADGGAVRVGFGIFNTENEVDSLCLAIRDIVRQYRV